MLLLPSDNGNNALASGLRRVRLGGFEEQSVEHVFHDSDGLLTVCLKRSALRSTAGTTAIIIVAPRLRRDGVRRPTHHLFEAGQSPEHETGPETGTDQSNTHVNYNSPAPFGTVFTKSELQDKLTTSFPSAHGSVSLLPVDL